MSFVLGDRAVQTSTTTGTSTLQLDAPATGLRSFVAEVGSGNTTAFLVVDAAGNWELNIGTVTSGSPDTLSRTNPPIKSSNANNLVSFPAGSKTVACVPVAALIPYLAAVPSYANGQILQRDSGNWVPRTVQQVLKTLGNTVTFKDIAAAATVDLGAADDIGVNVTGTGQSITSFGTQANALRLVRFATFSNTLVHSANIALRTGMDRIASGADVGLFLSDGAGAWDELAWWPGTAYQANDHYVSHSFHYPGLVEAPSGTANKMLPHFVSAASNRRVWITGCRYRIEDGTSVAFEIRKNGAGITGFTGLSATPTPTTTAPTHQALADGDMIEVIHSSPLGNPHNLSVTIFVQYGKHV